MNHRSKSSRFAGALVYAIAGVLLACTFGCVSTPAGGRASPVVPVATFTASATSADVVADVRSNFDVTVVQAKVHGVVEIRDGATGASLTPPRLVSPGKVYVWRREPKFSGEFDIGAPLPAWVESAPGLWRPGEAAALGYTFEPEA